MDEEDDATLANLFKTRHRRASTLAEHSPASKRRLSKACSSLNKNKEANAKNSSPRQIPRKGDIVWAKPFSHTWWPGQVNGFKGPLVSISFFGCNETHLLNSSEILRFEEKYALMLKMVGGKLSYEIGLALDELSRNIAMGLKCSCMFSAGDEDGSSAVKRGFNPQEILGFVINKAVVPQVDEGEIATVVRVSAALNAFRHGLVVCKTSEVDKGFRAEGVLDFVLDLAVNPLVDDKAFAQLNAFRRFTSVKPDWFYRLDWELEDSLEVYKVEVYLEQSDFTSEDEVYHGKTSDPVDISVKPQECELLDVNHKQEGEEICVINMAYFDRNEKYESLIYNDQVDADGGQSAGRGICRNTNHERILHSCTEGASEMSEVRCHTNISPVNDANDTVANVISASMKSDNVILTPHNYLNHMPKVDEQITFNSSIGAKLKNRTQVGSISMPVNCDKANSSAENLSQQAAPLSGGRLHCLPINKCSKLSPIKVLNSAIKPQSRTDVCFKTSNAAECIDAIPEVAPFAETALQIPANKRNLYSMNNHHLISKWKSFYISPLMKDGLHSTDNRMKPSGSNKKPKISSVLLNMKFPKDYTLPSKEELEKKFSVFGPLDSTGTKVFFYTGVGQVVFLHQADAVVAYNYVTRKKIFGQANVRFWFYKHDNCRKEGSSIPVAVHSSFNLKPCLTKSYLPQLIDKKKNHRVRFS